MRTARTQRLAGVTGLVLAASAVLGGSAAHAAVATDLASHAEDGTQADRESLNP